MARRQVIGLIFLLGGGWFLVTGLLWNDMGGIVSLGDSPDVPMTFGFAPVRFILGVLIYGAIAIGGMIMLPRRDGDDE